MKFKLSMLVVLVLILLCGCGSKEGPKKTADSTNGKEIVVFDVDLFEADKLYSLGQLCEMDVDGDGKNDSIILNKEPRAPLDGIEHYTISVNGNECKGEGTDVDSKLLAVKADGKNVFLVVCVEENAYSYSEFYRYQNGKLEHVGGLSDDIKRCEIKDSRISAMFPCDLVQSQSAYGYWIIDDNGKLVQEVSEEYILPNSNPFTISLLVDLPVHKEKDLSSETSIISPQKVSFTKTDALNWTYVEDMDGNGGWMYSNDLFEVEEVGLEKNDIFADLPQYN